jgi:hypothetical protein
VDQVVRQMTDHPVPVQPIRFLLRQPVLQIRSADRLPLVPRRFEF